MPLVRTTARGLVLSGALLASACAGLGEPAPAPSSGSLARHPPAAMMPGPESVGPAGTGPAGNGAYAGDGTAGF